MKPDSARQASLPFRYVGVIIVAISASVLLSTLGCSELDARRKIQEAGKLYQKGKFDQACPLYDEVLEISDAKAVAEVAHYNGGICYHKMFRPGRETPENKHVAARATHHFEKFLEIHPGDRAVVGMMSQIWMDSGDHQSAINYWEREYAKNREDTEVISILAGIYRQTGDWQKSIDWYYEEVKVHKSPAAKTGSLLKVANLMANKLNNREEIFWEERLRFADIGLTAGQKAESLSPDSLDVQQSLGALWRFRGEAHQAAWAQLIDRANARHHYRIAGALYREQQAKEAAASGQPLPETKPEAKPAGATPAPAGATPAPAGATPAPAGATPAPAAATPASAPGANP